MKASALGKSARRNPVKVPRSRRIVDPDPITGSAVEASSSCE